ncbi:Thioredoxin O, mitochondrial [Zea mays]|uniref:Thioredoxin O, mitochondrial n=1 Tax=Zea mays TaxID=4577 RepID=A0A3L6DDY9_MAIZE|nr:Thioredoxin O, mitochondrial [Zea mays]
MPPSPFRAALGDLRLFGLAVSGGSSMVVVGSADSFNSIFSKVQDEKLPAVFYYTAVWCGPCRAIAPLVSKLSSQYPKIPVYKVDIELWSVTMARTMPSLPGRAHARLAQWLEHLGMDKHA